MRRTASFIHSPQLNHPYPLAADASYSLFMHGCSILLRQKVFPAWSISARNRFYARHHVKQNRYQNIHFWASLDFYTLLLLWCVWWEWGLIKLIFIPTNRPTVYIRPELKISCEWGMRAPYLYTPQCINSSPLLSIPPSSCSAPLIHHHRMYEVRTRMANPSHPQLPPADVCINRGWPLHSLPLIIQSSHSVAGHLQFSDLELVLWSILLLLSMLNMCIPPPYQQRTGRHPSRLWRWIRSKAKSKSTRWANQYFHFAASPSSTWSPSSVGHHRYRVGYGGIAKTWLTCSRATEPPPVCIHKHTHTHKPPPLTKLCRPESMSFCLH